ncbi:hypothetical protein HG536_0C02120 [Torulaspora globosa]|uniref:Helicase ATP-binding domain-containing protein n=1 Tax=Torulaspora globosa TaxID=48254 RepID=A0A7G3ZEV7_9SACH|nr:uncharacterized protein HG536_0C02120 [Torulaspora globosa]QLL32043.1 hypothetical protein HG536_0C02120 [Torulaspora globosa]
MSMFQCVTCMETLDAEMMIRHLSSSRHKAIIDVFREEDVKCEECQDPNVHTLQIIRFGGDDMSLLCNSCFSKEYSGSDKPNTCHSLANGSLLRFWDNYLKVRDCSCEQCGKDRHLNVNDEKKVLCDSCLSKVPPAQANRFISENSGRFLYLFLGIRESSNSKTVRRKGGRKVGRGRTIDKRRKPREKKPLTVHEQIAKMAYETKKQNNIIESDSTTSLKSFKGLKASTSSNSSKPQTLKSPSNGKGNGTSKTLGNEKSSSPKPSSKSRATNTRSGSKNCKTDARSFKHTTASISNNRFENKSDSPAVKTPEAKKRRDTKAKNNGTASKSHESLEEQSKGQRDKKNKNNSKSTSSVKDPVDRNARNDKNRRKEGIVNDRAKSTKSSSEKILDKTKKLPAADKEKGSIGDDSQKDDTEEIEEGEPIKRLTKYVPQMTYPDLQTYFNEYSYALFLEQRLENDFLLDFQIIWPKNQDESSFVVSMKMKNNTELEKLLPPNLARLGRLPFVNRQPLILVTKDESRVWYAYVKETALKRDLLTVLLELYPWNRSKLPVRSANDAFKILPCSAQVSRIFFAMTRVKNPKFIDLILGQKPIKQINFQNRLEFSKESFNESQRSAIQHVLNNSVTILQGPPGTGKTSTIEEIILQMIKNFHSFPILCVAASNIAIDNIAEKFMVNRPDIKILRIVSEGKEPQYNSEHPLGKICLHNMVYEQLPQDMKDNIAKLRGGRAKDVSKNQYNKLLSQQNNISDRHVLQAQILFTTNIAAGGRQLKAIQELPVVIMDESTQSSEASTLVPLSLPGIRTFVFVGDEKQLSSFSNVPQLEMSLFERVLLNGCYKKPHMLDTQYRMHPKISEFPIAKFYQGQLKNGVTEEQKSWEGIEYPLYFYHCDKGFESKVFNRQRGMRGFTYNNRYECEEIKKIIYKLILEKNVRTDQIGIITPYSAQRDLISEMLVADTVVNPQGFAMEQELDEADLLDAGIAHSNGKKNTINIINGVYIATIDSFQGHEKEFVIFSCVRNNKENRIGFASDRKRLNVALTRAKNGLVLVGNSEVFRKGDPLWRDYVEYLEDRGLIFNDIESY